MFSIVATETSVLTFISVPGIAFRGDWTFLQLSLGYICGRLLVSFFLIPIYFKDGITSIYEVLEVRFGVLVQRLASLTFLFTRVLADSVRFAAIAIVIQAITNWSIVLSILVVGIVTLVYTVLGGLRTVIKIDAFQFFIYLLSACICIYSLVIYIDLPVKDIFSQLNNNNKFKIFDFKGNLFTKPFMFISAFIGGTMLSFASHGADYMMVQRVLATKNILSAKKAMIGSGIFVSIQFTLFLFIGSLIYIASGGMQIEKDQEMSYVIVNILPIGFKGIVVAGVLSAAMSTLSSSINSLSSSLIRDWIPRFNTLYVSRLVSVFWTVVLISTAIFFQNSNDALVIVGLKIASFTYGSLLSFFILSKFENDFKIPFIIIGYLSGILAVFYFIKFNIAWTFYILGSVICNVCIVLLLQKFKKILFFKYLITLLIIFLFTNIVVGSENILKSKESIISLKIDKKNNNDRLYLGFDVFNEIYSDFPDIKNIAVVVNHTSSLVSIDEENHNILSNLSHTHIKIVKIFTPEHGLKNIYQAGQRIDGDDTYNIPIISLYGRTFKLAIEDLEGLDAVIFDIQDIGSRYYTYVSTMTEVMNACAKAKIPLIIFDRPNPLGGKISGPVLNLKYSSFVGMHQIPIRHGMTIGELSYMINELNWLEDNLRANLKIVKMNGWNRNMYFEETNLNWIPPSPNIPNNITALVYNGMCLIEGTNLSEGRGTEMPFMQFGAPWLDSRKIIKLLNKRKLDGVSFKKVNFTPTDFSYHKYYNEKCNGVKIVVHDKILYHPLKTAIEILEIVQNVHPDRFKFLENNFIDKLYGSDKLRKCILSDDNQLGDLYEDWVLEENKFKTDSMRFLLY